MDMPPSRSLDDKIITGITMMQYNENRNELLTLGLDRRVSYWDLD